jgi:hypothetical protein
MPSLYKSTKEWLSFHLGRNPVIEKLRKDYRKFIPQPYEGVVIVSADFELAWAWRFDKLNPDPVNNCLVSAKRERENIPKLIALSERYNIPVTWGTVGHLFLEECKNKGPSPHPELGRLPYFENDYWKFDHGDWFAHDPCSSFASAPEWYAPDLVRQILDSKIGHEIGCHSFSHISCSDGTCPPEILKSELKASQQAAATFGLKLESFVFPGNTMGNYDTLRDAGYTSMRTNFINVLGYPKCHSNGLWEHKTTMELSYNRLFSVKHNLYRYKVIIDKCISNHQVCNLWFHPSFADINIETILPEVYKILQSNNQKLWITTMKEYTKWLILNHDPL